MVSGGLVQGLLQLPSVSIGEEESPPAPIQGGKAFGRTGLPLGETSSAEPSLRGDDHSLEEVRKGNHSTLLQPSTWERETLNSKQPVPCELEGKTEKHL